MELIVELKDINFQNSYGVFYKIGDTPGPSTHLTGFTKINGTYPPQTNKLLFNLFDIDDEPYGKEFWFKVVDLVTNTYIIKNIQIHEKVFYETVCEPTPQPTSSPTPTPNPTSTMVPTSTPNPTSTITPTPTFETTFEPQTNEFINVPSGIEGTLFITGITYSVFLSGTPFTMSPNPATQNSNPGGCNGCKSKINFFNTTLSSNIISFTLGGTSSASVFTNLKITDGIQDYFATFTGGKPTSQNAVFSFNVGSQKGRTFRFVGGEINLNYN